MDIKAKLDNYEKLCDDIINIENANKDKKGLLIMMAEQKIKQEANKISLLQVAANNKGITNLELATQLDKRPESISRHMNNKTQISIEDAEMYGKILDIPPAILLFPPDPVKIKGYLNFNPSPRNYDQADLLDIEVIEEKRFAIPPVNLPNCELMLSNEEGHHDCWDKILMLDTTPGDHYLEKNCYVRMTKESAKKHKVRPVGFYKPFKEPLGKLSLLVPYTDKVLAGCEVEEVYQVYATVDGNSHRSVWMISQENYYKRPVSSDNGSDWGQHTKL